MIIGKPCIVNEKDSNWYKFHLKIIGKIYFKNKILTPKLVFERFYLRIMMEMGL
jgi:hypothetical protein